ncbi:hypothetical protein HDU93_004519 [Gonapodya sp. JEL0774]|nr:hypothetical protein HDU93_004519 [Gonapodya sp. JEL0774]
MTASASTPLPSAETSINVAICLGGRRLRFSIPGHAESPGTLAAVEIAAAFSDRHYVVDPPDVLYSELVGDSHQVRAHNGVFLARSFLPKREYHFDPPELRTPTGGTVFGPHITRSRLQLSLLLSMACYERDPVAFLTGRDYALFNSFTWVGKAFNGDKVPYVVAMTDGTVDKSLSEIYIAFRGSVDLDDWKQNLYVAPKVATAVPSGPRTGAASLASESSKGDQHGHGSGQGINATDKAPGHVTGVDGSTFNLHAGYHSAASKIPLHLVRDAVQRRREQLVKLRGGGGDWENRPITIILCGHSAGGAIAHTFHAMWLLAGGGETAAGAGGVTAEGESVSAISLAFGSPYFACKAFGDYIYRHLRGTSDKFVTVCYGDDPVPRSLNLPENVNRYKSTVTSALARFAGILLGTPTSTMIHWATDFIPAMLHATSRDWKDWVKGMKEMYHPLGRYIFIKKLRESEGEYVTKFETRPEEIRVMLGPAEVESASDHDAVQIFRFLDRKGLIKVELNPDLVRATVEGQDTHINMSTGGASNTAPNYVRTDLLSPSIDRVWINELKQARSRRKVVVREVKRQETTNAALVIGAAQGEGEGSASSEPFLLVKETEAESMDIDGGQITDNGKHNGREESDDEEDKLKVIEVEIRGRSLDYLTGGISVKERFAQDTPPIENSSAGTPFVAAQAFVETAAQLIEKGRIRVAGSSKVKVLIEKLTEDPIVLQVDEERSTLECLVCRGYLHSAITGDRMMAVITLTTHFGETTFQMSDAMWTDGAKYDLASRLKNEFMVQLFYKALERYYAGTIFHWQESALLGDYLEKLEALCRKPGYRSFKTILNELRVQHGTDGLEKVMQACQQPVIEIFEAMSSPLVIRKRMGTAEQAGASAAGAFGGAALGILAVYMAPMLVTIAPLMYLALGSSTAGGIVGLMASRNFEYLNKEIRAREEVYRSTLENLCEEIGVLERATPASVDSNWRSFSTTQSKPKRPRRTNKKLTTFQLEKLIWRRASPHMSLDLDADELRHNGIFLPGGKLSEDNVTDRTLVEWHNRIRMVCLISEVRRCLLNTAFVAAIGPQKHGKSTALKQMYPNASVEGADYSIHTERLTFYEVPGANVTLVDFPGYTGVTGGTGHKVSAAVAESLKKAMLNCSVLASVIICVFKFGNRVDEEVLAFADVIRPMSAFFPLLLCLNQASRYEGFLRSPEEMEEKRMEYVTKLGLDNDVVRVTDFRLECEPERPPVGALSAEEEQMYLKMQLKVQNQLRQIGVWSSSDVRKWIDSQLSKSKQED